jgi:hypothetical protein
MSFPSVKTGASPRLVHTVPATRGSRPADSVAQRSHGNEQAGQEKTVDIDDPEQLGCGRRVRQADNGQGKAMIASPTHSLKLALLGVSPDTLAHFSSSLSCMKD